MNIGIVNEVVVQEDKPVKDASLYMRAFQHHGYSLRIFAGPMTAEACMGLDVIVGADLENLLPLVHTVPNLLLFSQPKNVHKKEPEGIVRVEDWHAVYNHIRYEL